jgi:glutaredoxin
MNNLEIFLSHLSFSWTEAKLIPFILAIIIGLFFSVIFFKRIKTLKSVKIFISFVLFVFPFAIYFAYAPIYSGDFSNDFYRPQLKNEFPTAKKLSVYVLPTCPYCIQATSTLVAMMQKNKQINLEINVLCSNAKEADKYLNLMKGYGLVKVRSDNPEYLIRHKDLLKLTEGQFPTYILSENKMVLKAWHNDTFGVDAMDEINQFFK